MPCLFERITSRPEEDLLICCVTVYGTAERTKAIRSLIQREIDWSYLLKIAAHHGLMPLLYKHLSTTCPDAIPKRTLDRLRNYFRNNAVRNLFLTRELLKLLQLLDAHEVPAIPFKGPVLAAACYGDVALREFEDLDILVHQRDVPNARRLLVSQGYRPQFLLNEEQEAIYLRSHHALSFTGVDRSVVVDLHWAITRLPLAPDTEESWRRLQTISVLGREIPTFSPEDLLLVLCVHGAKHRWTFLGWICDVAVLIDRHDGIDWDRVFNQASLRGSERMLLLGLSLVTGLLGALLPQEVSKRLQTRPDVEALANQVYRDLFRNADVPPGRFEGYTFYLRAMDRFTDRLRHCYLELAPTPLEWALLPLPARLFPVYYLLRPIRLAGKYLLRLARHISVRITPGK